jgi:hypothetical protein
MASWFIPSAGQTATRGFAGGTSGTPKTTLADVLAPALNLPVLHNDALVLGIWRTRHLAMELRPSNIEPSYRSMELWHAEALFRPSAQRG